MPVSYLNQFLRTEIGAWRDVVVERDQFMSGGKNQNYCTLNRFRSWRALLPLATTTPT